MIKQYHGMRKIDHSLVTRDFVHIANIKGSSLQSLRDKGVINLVKSDFKGWTTHYYALIKK